MIVTPHPDPAPPARPGHVQLVDVVWGQKLHGRNVICVIPAMWRHKVNWQGHGRCYVVK